MAQDILLDNLNDLLVSGGDFAVGESTAQEVENILMSYQGWWKQNPLIGCAAPSYIASPGDCEPLRRQAQIQLQSDNKQLTEFDYSSDSNGNLTININGVIVTIPA